MEPSKIRTKLMNWSSHITGCCFHVHHELKWRVYLRTVVRWLHGWGTIDLTLLSIALVISSAVTLVHCMMSSFHLPLGFGICQSYLVSFLFLSMCLSFAWCSQNRRVLEFNWFQQLSLCACFFEYPFICVSLYPWNLKNQAKSSHFKSAKSETVCHCLPWLAFRGN